MKVYPELSPVTDLLGRPLQDLRISVTDRCNFNCTYCMPDRNMTFLPKSEILSFEEIVTVVSILRDFGVNKIKITGGEPTLRMGLDILIRKLKAIEGIEDIGMITNAVFLKGLAGRLFDAGLRRLNVSLDAIDQRIFQSIVGETHSIHPVLEGIECARKTGFSPIKINCVIQRGVNDDQVLPLAEYFRERKLQIRFIEFMDVGAIDWDQSQVVSSNELLDIIQKKYKLVALAPAHRGEVAKRYKYADTDCEIGFISSVSQPFCADCNRLRLTADGTLYGCLFATEGTNIKKYLRSENAEEELRGQLKEFWLQRRDRYSELRKDSHPIEGKKNMNFIGG